MFRSDRPIQPRLEDYVQIPENVGESLQRPLYQAGQDRFSRSSTTTHSEGDTLTREAICSSAGSEISEITEIGENSGRPNSLCVGSVAN